MIEINSGNQLDLSVEPILDILLKLAHHSHVTAGLILECPNLIELITQNFIQVSWPVEKVPFHF